jgi:hypothetical protein
MIKLKNLINEKKFRMPPGFKQTMKLFNSKSFQEFTKDRYNIDISNAFTISHKEKNKSGIANMTQDVKDKSIFFDFIMYLLKKNLIK